MGEKSERGKEREREREREERERERERVHYPLLARYVKNLPVLCERTIIWALAYSYENR